MGQRDKKRKLELDIYKKERAKGVPPKMATNYAKKKAREKYG